MTAKVRGGGGRPGRGLPIPPRPPPPPRKAPGARGRRYGSVSGDLNPIHIHPLTARLFGFPSAIAHGMWTKARSLAALEARLPPAYTAGVAFKRPILLPGKVAFGEDEHVASHPEGAISFGVRSVRDDT